MQSRRKKQNCARETDWKGEHAASANRRSLCNANRGECQSLVLSTVVSVVRALMQAPDHGGRRPCFLTAAWWVDRGGSWEGDCDVVVMYTEDIHRRGRFQLRELLASCVQVVVKADNCTCSTMSHFIFQGIARCQPRRRDLASKGHCASQVSGERGHKGTTESALHPSSQIQSH